MRTNIWIMPALAGTILLLYVLIPIISVFARVSAVQIVTGVTSPLIYNALRISLISTGISVTLVILFGLPMAYLLARYSFRGKEAIDTLVDLPMVLPPAVAGVALLMAFGRRGLLGSYLAVLNIDVSFSLAAVVMAQTFVAAPFFIKAARSGFASVDPVLEQVSLTTGKSPWQTFVAVTLPLSFQSILGGAVMTWARALGEFGATIMFAGNLMGRTQTLPLAIYTAMESDLDAALVISAILVAISFFVLLTVKRLSKQGG